MLDFTHRKTHSRWQWNSLELSNFVFLFTSIKCTSENPNKQCLYWSLLDMPLLKSLHNFERLMNIGIHFWEGLYKNHENLVERPAAEIGVLLTNSGSALSLFRMSILERCVFHRII